MIVSIEEKSMVTLGSKIKELRKKAGLSQQRLADLLNLKRPTISQIENGERKIYAEELCRLAEIFNTSADRILGLSKAPEVTLQENERKASSRPAIRVNVPRRNINKFKEVLLYILNKVGSKRNIGETVIYKLLYFIDFNFYEKYEEQLIGATYIKNKYGPTPIEFQKIIEEMLDKDIIKVKSKYFKYPQTKYLPLRKEDGSKLDARELQVIDEVLNRLSDMTAANISVYSHYDVPWMTTEDGEKIEYETVFYRTPAYSVRDQDDDIS